MLKPTEKKGIQYPGKISYVSPSGQGFYGCAVQQFETAEAMELFFKENPGYQLVDLKTNVAFDDAGRSLIYYVAIYTSVLQEEELELLKDRADAIEQLTQEKREARLKLQQEQEEHQEKVRKEEQRLIGVGAKCEKDHGGLDKERQEHADFRARVKRNVTKEQWAQLTKKEKAPDEG